MEPPDQDFVSPRTMNEGNQVELKQVWKRKDDGLLVRVSGLIFLEPKRVMWQALPNQVNASAYGTVTETEFKKQYEFQPQKRAGPN
jgi:hypothetical protein